ncbi:Metallo-dependent phosphatase [Glarea lozoyensis ATCC 20868]|uniref:Metallo-dependent phosphatase n=1 Tax=Glarea lozoyensis (strain ATCC 20868 / MF5171) TaxID=1116229 RepID=S3CEM2_GLAL2|nr:Metallo-dependent phosphatase [Glarea lozoyensis ATCC 20868]EPE24455.1 Metallo-dependent phosphatase [Glarea lozoyensis ATCC 20868]
MDAESLQCMSAKPIVIVHFIPFTQVVVGLSSASCVKFAQNSRFWKIENGTYSAAQCHINTILIRTAISEHELKRASEFASPTSPAVFGAEAESLATKNMGESTACFGCGLPKDATPHHLVLLADPQLIDPHSYPGRPWPLDKFTMMHTDNYMKRSYISLQQELHPDTIFFLGDLFDGGREWKTAHGNTVDPSWANGLRPSGEMKYVDTWGKRYGEDFWLHEYDRFGRIFYKYWNLAGAEARPGQRGRRIISSLPGNHDLGFGAQIKIPIRNRFEVYFGEGNRVDVIANHTFVSIDAVSLSAGSDEHGTAAITQPVEDFLAKVKITKRKAVASELSRLAGKGERVLPHKHGVEDLAKTDFSKMMTLDPGPDAPEFPTFLLTHVPLYREPGKPCGPQREHWPPATPPKGETGPVVPDHRNAISISKGYQYQNVLSESDSIKVIASIGDVERVFSGDDHDYCEIVHPENKNKAREITVKAFSWAMGVRKPGFLMLSMWNPVDANGKPLHSSPSGHGSSNQKPLTTETHLCLLPDQLSIFIRYGILIGISILALLTRAILTPILNLPQFSPPPQLESYSLLPTTRPNRRYDTSPEETSSNSSTSSTSSNTLAPRTAARTRSASPVGGYGLPSHQATFSTPVNGYAKDDYDFENEVGKKRDGTGSRKPSTPLGIVWKELWVMFWRVLWMVMVMYTWLVWSYPT